MLPFEFTIDGPPVSQRAKSKQGRRRWRSKLQAAIGAIWKGPARDDEVEVEITNFYRSDALDVDNVIKPILDAMTGLVYLDDNLVVSVTSRKVSLGENARIEVRSAKVDDKLNEGVEFLHVQVRSGFEARGVES